MDLVEQLLGQEKLERIQKYVSFSRPAKTAIINHYTTFFTILAKLTPFSSIKSPS